MKMRFVFLLSIIAVAFFIAAPRLVAAGGATKMVSPDSRFSIEQPNNSGQWKSNDLTVEYSYSKDQGQMDISGNVRFATYLSLGYGNLHEFRLGAIFLDENGRVIEQTGLVTNRGDLGEIAFKRKIKLPLNAVSMAFTYQGSAASSGGNGAGPISFSFYPVH